MKSRGRSNVYYGIVHTHLSRLSSIFSAMAGLSIHWMHLSVLPFAFYRFTAQLSFKQAEWAVSKISLNLLTKTTSIRILSVMYRCLILCMIYVLFVENSFENVVWPFWFKYWHVRSGLFCSWHCVYARRYGQLNLLISGLWGITFKLFNKIHWFDLVIKWFLSKRSQNFPRHVQSRVYGVHPTNYAHGSYAHCLVLFDFMHILQDYFIEPLARYVKLRVAHARAVMHVGIANPRWRGKGLRHSRCMHNPQFCVSGKRHMALRQWIT